MTNNPTIDGVSREDERHAAVKALHGVMQSVPSASLYSLAEAVLDAGYATTCKTCGGSKTVFQLGFMSLDDGSDEPCPDCVPAVKPPNALREHCKQCAEVVKTWPEWKQNCLGDAPAVERQDRTAHSMKSVAEAVDASRCYTVLTSNQCYALAQSLNNQAVRVSAAENDALQSTIARLEARIAELESGRGEPVAWMYLERSEDGYEYRPLFSPTKWLVLPDGFYEEIELYAAPPAPVAVVLPERIAFTSQGSFDQGWNACLDATAALNEKPKQ